jgi:hypothetical protein
LRGVFGKIVTEDGLGYFKKGYLIVDRGLVKGIYVTEHFVHIPIIGALGGYVQLIRWRCLLIVVPRVPGFDRAQ